MLATGGRDDRRHLRLTGMNQVTPEAAAWVIPFLGVDAPGGVSTRSGPPARLEKAAWLHVHPYPVTIMGEVLPALPPSWTCRRTMPCPLQ
jgi:hypothetical protein